MASTVFVDVGMSLDGFIAGPNASPHNPMGGASARIHEWAFRLRSFRELLSMGVGGETGADDDLFGATTNRIGANVMGRRMFDEGEVCWPERAPFGGPVFVLTHSPREDWSRPGGTTFIFVGADIKTVLERAREAAGDRDVRISGGADVIRQFLDAGLVDEIQIHLAPILLGAGTRLFDGLRTQPTDLELISVQESSTGVLHTRFQPRDSGRH